MPRVYAVNPAPLDVGFPNPQRPMAQKKKRSAAHSTPKRGANGQFLPAKGRRANPPKKNKQKAKDPRALYSKETKGKETIITRVNPAKIDPTTLVKQGVAVLAGQVVSGVISGKLVEMLPGDMSTRTQALIGAGVSAALAVVAIKQDDNPIVQMVGVGAAVQTAKTAIKTFAPDVPGLGDAAALSDAMDLGEIALRTSIPRTPRPIVRVVPPRSLPPGYPVMETIQPVLPPVYADITAPDEGYTRPNPALPLVDKPKSRTANAVDKIPASLRFAGAELGSPLDYQTVM